MADGGFGWMFPVEGKQGVATHGLELLLMIEDEGVQLTAVLGHHKPLSGYLVGLAAVSGSYQRLKVETSS